MDRAMRNLNFPTLRVWYLTVKSPKSNGVRRQTVQPIQRNEKREGKKNMGALGKRIQVRRMTGRTLGI